MPGLVDRVLALHAGSRGFDSHRGHMSERFFRSNRPGYPHPVSSELEISCIRVVVGDCSVTERRWWRPPYQTGKTVHVHANTTNTTRTDARRRVCAVPYSGNVVTRIGTHTHTHTVSVLLWHYGVSLCDQSPVVQSIISLTSSLRGQLVKCFTIL